MNTGATTRGDFNSERDNLRNLRVGGFVASSRNLRFEAGCRYA